MDVVGVSHCPAPPTHSSAGPDPIPALVASTMGSVLIRYYFQLPPSGDRISEPSVAMLAGKDYALLHGAPVVGVFILDHAGLPIPSVYEQDNQMAPGVCVGAVTVSPLCPLHCHLLLLQHQRWWPRTLL